MIFHPRSHHLARVLIALCIASIPLGLGLTFPMPSTVQAAALIVTTLADSVDADGSCSLREVIQAANTNLALNECPADSPGIDPITITATGTIVLGSALPSITQTLVLIGPGAALLSSSGILNNAGMATLRNTIVANNTASTSGGQLQRHHDRRRE